MGAKLNSFKHDWVENLRSCSSSMVGVVLGFFLFAHESQPLLGILVMGVFIFPYLLLLVFGGKQLGLQGVMDLLAHGLMAVFMTSFTAVSLGVLIP